MATAPNSLKSCAKVAMKLVDIGANLGHPNFQRDLLSVIHRAKEAGVCKIMVTGTSLQISWEAKMLAEQHPGFLYHTAGVHPHDAKEFSAESSIVELETLLESEQCVAVGECGLDFNRNFSPPDDQRTAFDAQVQLACRLSKPLFVHEREASTDLLTILDRYSSTLPSVVVHCFTGTDAEAVAYLQRGFYIGLTGSLWKDRLPNGVQHALSTGVLPMDRILLETDAPFMYPNVLADKNKKLPESLIGVLSEGSEGFLRTHCSFKRNEPCSLAATCEMIASFLKVDPAELAQKTTENAFKVFGLGS